MLESIGAYLINYYLGEFLEDVNYDQLKFQLLSGEISLEHVPIRRGSTLHRFGLPIDIRSGSVTQIKIARPAATRFFQDPFVINITGIELALAPADGDEPSKRQNEKEAEKMKQNGKERVAQLINRLEMVGQQQGLWSSYSSAIVTQIVQNIQIKIEDVLISYSDVEILGNESLGFSIAAVNVVNITPEEPTKETAKKMELLQLRTFEGQRENKEYLLEPVDLDVIITKNKNPLPLQGDEARFNVDVSVGDVVLRLSDRQHHALYSIVEKLDWFRRRQRFSVGRPLTPIRRASDEERSALVREWWSWAIKVHHQPIERYHKRKTKEFIIQRVRDINTYKRLVLKKLKKEVLTEEEKQHKDRIEESWEYDELKAVIYAAIDREYRPPSPSSASSESSKEGWGSWMMRGGGLLGAGPEEIPKDAQGPVTTPPQNENKETRPQLSLKASQSPLKESAEFTISNDSFLTRDDKFAALTFALTSGELRLRVSDGPLATVKFTRLSALMQFKFRQEAIISIVELGEVTVVDSATKNSIYPNLVSSNSKQHAKTTNSPVFHFSHERAGQMQESGAIFTFFSYL